MIETPEVSKMDVVLFVMVGGLEIPLLVPSEQRDIAWDTLNVFIGESYHNHRIIVVNMRNVLFVDRLSEEEYRRELNEVKARRMLQEGMNVPIMKIPGGGGRRIQ